MRVLWLAWSLLTCMSALLCSGGSLLPYWLRGSLVSPRPSKSAQLSKSENFSPSASAQTASLAVLNSDLGLFRRCTYPVYTEDGQVALVERCGHYVFFAMPHLYWQMCLVLLGLACSILLYLTFLLFFMACCCHEVMKTPAVFHSCQIAQLFAGLLALSACILYPFGWRGNSEVVQMCGQAAGMFSLGRCQIGWAYVLTASGGVLSLLAVSLPCLYCREKAVEQQASRQLTMTTSNGGGPHSATTTIANGNGTVGGHRLLKASSSVISIPNHILKAQTLSHLNRPYTPTNSTTVNLVPVDRLRLLGPSPAVSLLSLPYHQHFQQPQPKYHKSTNSMMNGVNRPHSVVITPHNLVTAEMGLLVNSRGTRRPQGPLLPNGHHYKRFSQCPTYQRRDVTEEVDEDVANCSTFAREANGEENQQQWQGISHSLVDKDVTDDTHQI